jgi:GWxTD domain-containing protein
MNSSGLIMHNKFPGQMKSGFTLFLTGCFFLLIIGFGCTSTGKLATQNLAELYQPDQQLNGLSYAVFNLDDSIAQLYYRFPLENLKLKKMTGKAAFASYKLNFQVFDGYKKGMLVDSGTIAGIDSVHLSGTMFDSLQLKVATGKNYIVQLNFTDLNAGVSNMRLVNLPKARHGLSADFLLTDTSNKPIMRNYISRVEKVRIRTRFPVNAALGIKRHNFPVRVAAKTPFSYSAVEEPESIDVENEIEINIPGSLSEPFNFAGEGILLMEQFSEGFIINRFYDGFPKIGSSGIMRESLRYIATDEEYNEMMALPAKAAVDQFWIGLTGNSERALSQIKRYYSRVESANELFSVSGEGWMSDRGMVYIVFGPPSIVYRNAEVEEWTFGEAGNALSVRFYFHPFQHSIGIEDYKLLRMEEYRRPWHLAVSNWRR